MVAVGKTFPTTVKMINPFIYHLHTEIYQLHISQFKRTEKVYSIKKVPQILRDLLVKAILTGYIDYPATCLRMIFKAAPALNHSICCWL